MKPRNKPESWLQLQVSPKTGLPTGQSFTRAYSHTEGDVHYYASLRTDEGTVKSYGYCVGYWDKNVLRLFMNSTEESWMGGPSESNGTRYMIINFDDMTSKTWCIDENNRVSLEDMAVIKVGVDDGP